MNQSLRLAFCSMVTAVSAILMFLAGVIPVGTYAIPALAGVLLLAVVVELGPGWSWSVYLAVSLLSAWICADKEAVLFFVLLFGCYPILKAGIEKRAGRLFGTVLKFALFNFAAILEFFLATCLLSVPRSSYTVFGVYLPWVFLAAGNLVFAVYDYALSLLAAAYWKKWHGMVSKWLHSR